MKNIKARTENNDDYFSNKKGNYKKTHIKFVKYVYR